MLSLETNILHLTFVSTAIAELPNAVYEDVPDVTALVNAAACKLLKDKV